MAIKKISANLLGNNAVTADKIADGAISAADIADNSITAAKLSASTSPTFGGLTTTGDINLGDNDKAVFGADSDLQIYHDGSNSFIADVGSGNLGIRAENLFLQNADGSENYATATLNGAFTLSYDNSVRLATTSTGIDVTGTVVADGLTLANSTYIRQNDTASGLPRVFGLNSSNDMYIGPIDPYAGGAVLYGVASDVSSQVLYTDAIQRLRISSGGDISFYEDTGATAKLFWDASAESLSIGTTGSTTDRRFQVSETGPSTATTQYGIVANPTYPTNVTANVYNLYTGPNLTAGTTLTNLYNIYLESNGYPSSTVTNSYGIYQAGANDKNYFAGNVGIGTDNPTGAKLHVVGGVKATDLIAHDSTGINLQTDEGTKRLVVTDTGNITFPGQTSTFNGPGFTHYTNNYLYLRGGSSGLILSDDSGINVIQIIDGAGGYINFETSNGTSRMRIDSSGNLLHGCTGTTGTAISDGGILLRSDSTNYMQISSGSTGASDFIIFYKKSGTGVAGAGSIGVDSNGHNYYCSDSGITVLGQPAYTNFEVVDSEASAAPRIRPSVDNLCDLGDSGRRFDDVWATNGTIQTSDRNEKQDIEELSEAETRVAVAAKGLLKKYRWKSAVEEKGDEARIHFGIIAQDLQDAFTAEGLDASRYAMFTSNTWTDEETGEERTRLGVRYSELLAFIIAGI